MIKSFAIIGRKGTGRSEVLTALVAYLKERGYRVGVVRHLKRDDIEIDQPGKDTYEYRMQGAEKVILSGRKRCATFENRTEELSIAELLKSFDGYDFLFFEEYYSNQLPTIEVYKEEEGMLLSEKSSWKIAACSDIREVPLLVEFLEQFNEMKKEEILPC